MRSFLQQVDSGDWSPINSPFMQANAQPAAAKGGGAPQSEDQDQPALIKMTNQCLLNHDMPVRLPQKAAAQVPCGAAACRARPARALQLPP